MGALHEGHLALVERARELADTVVVSIFVNPTQFGANEDFDKYPRTLEHDRSLLAPLGVEVFAPTVDEVYPERASVEPVETRIEIPVSISSFAATQPTTILEGATRPGHFDGMLTVVARLFDLVKPDIAVFGQKDAQQVFLVRKLIEQAYPHIRLEVVPTVRESDGLAKSSRNRYLSIDERQHALVLFRALTNMSLRMMSATSTGEALAEARAFVEAEPEVRLDYLEIVDPASFTPVDESFRGPATAVVAAWVGQTRLIDTINLVIN
jgi:pantoate--beta-alanine ligase